VGRGASRLRECSLVLDANRLVAHRQHVAIQLTRSEFLLLSTLHQHLGTVVSRAALMEAIWRGEQNTSANALDVLINALRIKIDAQHSTKMISTIRGMGYRLELDAREVGTTPGRVL